MNENELLEIEEMLQGEYNFADEAILEELRQDVPKLIAEIRRLRARLLTPAAPDRACATCELRHECIYTTGLGDYCKDWSPCG